MDPARAADVSPAKQKTSAPAQSLAAICRFDLNQIRRGRPTCPPPDHQKTPALSEVLSSLVSAAFFAERERVRRGYAAAAARRYEKKIPTRNACVARRQKDSDAQCMRGEETERFQRAMHARREDTNNFLQKKIWRKKHENRFYRTWNYG